MRVSAADLERLAAHYGVTVPQLLAPPEAAGAGQRLDRIQRVAEGLSSEDFDRWLALGESLARRA
jgi:hypothetical protein